MESLNTYYGMAMNDYLFAKSGMDTCQQLGNFNSVASICAQSGEKFLKAIIEKTFSEVKTDHEVLSLLHSHNLRALYNKVVSQHELHCSSKDCKWLGDFYFDARYPGDNFIVVNQEDAEECLRITEELQQDTEEILNRLLQEQNRTKKELNQFKAF